MDAEARRHLIEFIGALKDGDDASALALLDKRRVTIHTLYPYRMHGADMTIPVSFVVIQAGREQVARALVRLGANIDALHNFSADSNPIDGDAVTPTGAAILEGSVSSLALCHRLGANLSIAGRRSSRMETALDRASLIEAI